MQASQIYQVLLAGKITEPLLPKSMVREGGLFGSASLNILTPFFQPDEKDLAKQFWQGLVVQEENIFANWRLLNLTPLLYFMMRRHRWQSNFSPWVMEELRVDYGRSLKTASLQEQEIQAVLKSLANNGIEVILLKGADLRRRLYGDPALRPMVDLDLLIARDSVTRARRLLGEMDYVVYNLGENSVIGMKERFGNELLFRPPPGKFLLVDLHWEIEAVAQLYRLPYKEALASSQSIDYDGLSVKVLSPEHLLINLCLHLVSHWPMGSGNNQTPMALQIIDLVWALRGLNLDWSCFLHEVERFRFTLPVYIVFQEIAGFASDLTPPEILTALGNVRASWHEVVVLLLWHGLGQTYHRYPWVEYYLPRFSPLRRLWKRHLS